ncbi:hypothetical protein OF897_20995 [Chryseobacterium formosus]|uniref:Tetratricopeptide repeat protein n=1 Tax=Chryseobacterium formosus TaxID=1537363 RepID=A0ABT3XXJ6_9FLAO|nr:hypothetical protein [Chryseobacterium formosus]MCX8526398.1 hypothetical protein [Chryseobacterium formosus]
MKYKTYSKNIEFLKTVCFRVFLLLTIFVSIRLFSITRNEKKIDSLIALADDFVHRDYQKTLLYSTQASRIAEKESNSEKKAWSYFYMAKSMALLSKFRESALYIDKGLKEKATEETPILKALLKLLKTSLYSRLGMDNLLIEEGNDILEILENDRSIEARLVKARTFYNLSLAVSDRKQSDHFAHQCQNILNQISEKQYDDVRTIFKFKSYFYNVRGEILLERKNLDSAQYYFFKAYHDSFKDGYLSKNTFLNSIGNLYREKGDQKRALEYYLKTLADINQHDKDAFAKNGPGLLKEIYTIYKLSGG